MATPLTDSINALTAYANDVTGENYTNLSDAVHTLANGYSRMIIGSFVPTKTSVAYTLDTQSTEWTKLIIVPRIYPYEAGSARCIGIKFISLETMYMVSAFGGSSSSSVKASTGSSYMVNSENDDYVTVQDGVIVFGGDQAHGGLFVKDCVYDWYAW